jgi:hypothetical protein
MALLDRLAVTDDRPGPWPADAAADLFRKP